MPCSEQKQKPKKEKKNGCPGAYHVFFFQTNPAKISFFSALLHQIKALEKLPNSFSQSNQSQTEFTMAFFNGWITLCDILISQKRHAKIFPKVSKLSTMHSCLNPYVQSKYLNI